MPKRSLMLAGGGVKIAFQAGVLQVWLDEAGLSFDHGDAVSAACFNLAMWAQGMSGTQIADNWRNLDPVAGVDVHVAQLAKLIYAESLFDLDAYRHKIFPAWGFDWEKIRASRREATFNVFNFTKQELVSLTPPEMNEDMLVAAASLPIWFPPVRAGGDTFIDAVFNTASNLEEAIRRGADELWVIWTTSERGEWFDGFVGNFFGIFEATANGNYRAVKARIARNNDAIARGLPGEFGRPIALRELKAEVPMHYLLNFSKDRAAEVVNRGVEAARAWCREHGVPCRAGADVPTEVHRSATALELTEPLHGYLGFGAADCDAGAAQGKSAGDAVQARFHVRIDGVNRFVTRPEHDASLGGTITCARLGGARAIQSGAFNLFVDAGDPTRRKVTYRARFDDARGAPLTLVGWKDLHDDPGPDGWTDTSTMFAKLYSGDVAPGAEAAAELLAAGVLRLGMLDFAKLCASFRAEAPTLSERAAVLARFGAFFLGKLWDVYARRLLPYGPF